MIIDTYKHKGLRRQLVDVLKAKGITDKTVLDALMEVPRHIFFTKDFEHYSYEDKAFPIAGGQTISQPFTVAMQSQLMDCKAGDKVLEIGTGSGYQSAVLCAMGLDVYSSEVVEVLHKKAGKYLELLGYTPQLHLSTGDLGWAEMAPFDKIIVTCGAEEVPNELMAQLKVGGIMVIPAGKGDDKTMLKIERQNATKFVSSNHGIFRFVPLV
ncbi:MAG: protein-L-isoaspartate(D-aspartate) O-methyltransferase [Bacteroidota bacterium]|nr:protein-L-isoaspartate(D-aspartate) O-methyltransferase [Bacteroidota bacterium]